MHGNPLALQKRSLVKLYQKMTNCAVVKVAQCAAEDQELLDEKASMVVAKYDTFE